LLTSIAVFDEKKKKKEKKVGEDLKKIEIKERKTNNKKDHPKGEENA